MFYDGALPVSLPGFLNFHDCVIVPGFKNTQVDALSRLHGPSDTNEDPEPVLSAFFFFFVNLLLWSIDEQIAETSNSEPALPGCPPDCTYVPRYFRTPEDIVSGPQLFYVCGRLSFHS